ncbi:unnamed protein product [Caenorhabditis angaria]|uniref:BTB domain-containing protein n=1 Tax=Caenorhabditis angaria TaxID=860376 RepID=A0A9P1IAF5_9PELO|nr:unnamed protein product [Caenorhabditis angaria]
MSIKSEVTSSTSDTDSTGHGSFKFDYDAVVRIKYIGEEQKEEEEPVFAHRLVLSSFSPLFRQLISDSKSTDDVIVSIDLDLTIFPNSLAAFRCIVDALYSGEIKLNDVSMAEALAVCRFCQISSMESKIMSAVSIPNNFNISTIFNQNDQNGSSEVQQYLSTMLQLWTNPLFGALCQHQTTSTSSSFSSTSSSSSTNASGASSIIPNLSAVMAAALTSSSSDESQTQSEGSSPRANSVATPPNSSDMEKIVPNDDKEGWCRNKKYIEKVADGFMCTVCRKIYGRYNSVSYHVTIYHRNPPIRCEENGCNFSTREARYIHFHKYYRHHIPLPENIDLGSRKCPFCRHVSKSPAMLDKHIARHENEGNTNGSLKRSAHRKKQVCTSTTSIIPSNLPDLLSSSSNSSSSSSSASSFLPTSIHNNAQFLQPFPPPTTPMKCTLCSFSTYATDILFMHLATTHAQELSQLSKNDNNSTNDDNLIGIRGGDDEIVDVDEKIEGGENDVLIKHHLNISQVLDAPTI